MNNMFEGCSTLTTITGLDTLNKSVVNKIVVYDMKTVTPFYDYTIIASCNSSRQGHAAVNYLRDLVKDGFNIMGTCIKYIWFF